MRFISAEYIFPITSEPIKNGVVGLNEEGTITEVTSSEKVGYEIEKYEGIICPGFINAHCHLELSYMKGQINEHTGLTGFISEFVQKRSQLNKETVLPAIESAEKEMINNGIVAVGDISNDDSTVNQKIKQNIFYHTFMETFDLIPSRSNECFENSLNLQKKFNPLRSSIVPHAPYSVSPDLFKLITSNSKLQTSLLSIHNQETESENELFVDKTGKLKDFFQALNNDLVHIPLTGKRSLQSYLPLLPKENKILFVHNTFTNHDDIKFAHQYSRNIYWCFCPNANLYIENRLPDFKTFISENANICMGTDSYASNWSLSVLDELKTISHYMPHIELNTLLNWATINGAQFLGIENQYGSLEIGKRPGINLVKNINKENLQLKPESRVEKLN